MLCGERQKEELGRKGQGTMPDVASRTVCRLLPWTRSVRGGTASPSFCCVPFRESCVAIETMINVCSLLTLLPGTIGLSYSKFTTWFFQPKISWYLSSVTDLRLLAFWTCIHTYLPYEFEYITPLSTQHSTDAWHDLCVLRLLLSRLQQSVDRQILIANILDDMPI